MALITIAVDLLFRWIDHVFVHSTEEERAALEFDEVWVTIVTVVCWFCYFWIAVGLPGQTVGMIIVGVCVVQINGNNDVPLGRAATRAAVWFVTVIFWPFTM